MQSHPSARLTDAGIRIRAGASVLEQEIDEDQLIDMELGARRLWLR